MPSDDHAEEIQRQRWAVGARLRVLRRERGYSQVQLAERIGIDHRTISRIENGVHATDIDMLWRISNGLGVESWQLFRDE
ncbi:helix-turn-helix domain-containing protein [Kitasatospora indigofera]|uniref:helix-turn-helix domain-containing protein n=1 Tax=Kitasatospora indigofera TaxID=67307 RepID=UPI0036773842